MYIVKRELMIGTAYFSGYAVLEKTGVVVPDFPFCVKMLLSLRTMRMLVKYPKDGDGEPLLNALTMILFMAILRRIKKYGYSC